nr:MAG TPA: hypothetical protein [Caudoviricetes sp.]
MPSLVHIIRKVKRLARKGCTRSGENPAWKCQPLIHAKSVR